MKTGDYILLAIAAALFLAALYAHHKGYWYFGMPCPKGEWCGGGY